VLTAGTICSLIVTNYAVSIAKLVMKLKFET